MDTFMVAGRQDPTLNLFLEEHALGRLLNHRVSFHICSHSGSVMRVNRGWVLRAGRIVHMLLQLSLLLSHCLEPLELIQWLIQSILLLLHSQMCSYPVNHVGSLHGAHDYNLLVAWRLKHVLRTADLTARVSTDHQQSSVTVLAVSCIILYLLLESGELLTWRIIFHFMVGDNCWSVLFSDIARLRHIILIDIYQLAWAVRIELLHNRLARVVILSTCSGWDH